MITRPCCFGSVNGAAAIPSRSRLADYERCRTGVVVSLSRNIELYAPLTGIHHRVGSETGPGALGRPCRRAAAAAAAALAGGWHRLALSSSCWRRRPVVFHHDAQSARSQQRSLCATDHYRGLTVHTGAAAAADRAQLEGSVPHPFSASLPSLPLSLAPPRSTPPLLHYASQVVWRRNKVDKLQDSVRVRLLKQVRFQFSSRKHQ